MTRQLSELGQDPNTELVPALKAAFDGLEGRELLAPLITRAFPGRIALVSSFGAESVVLLHMVAQVDRSTPVLFLNTGKLFGETLAYRESLVERFGLMDVRDLRPDPVETAHRDPSGDLWNSDAEACCWFRKVLPLQRALTGFSAWITGRKRFQTPGRASLETFEEEFDRVKVNPLAGWPLKRIVRYIEDNDLPRHPLVEKGYASIGCAPCTSPVSSKEDARAGRWRGDVKTECGIHYDGLSPVRAKATENDTAYVMGKPD